MRSAALALLAGLVLAACNKPTVADCEELCRKYSELAFFEKLGASLDGLSPEEAARVEAERRAEWDAAQNDEAHLKKLDNCVTGCRQGGKRHMVSCVAAAETVAQADACLKD